MSSASPGAALPSRLPGLGRSARGGIVLMVASCGLLAAGDAISKWLTQTLPIGQIVFLRGLVIVTLVVALCGPRRLGELRPRDTGGHARRALLFVAATFLMIWSLKLLPLPTVSAISFAAPIFMTALAPVMLAETVGRRRWGAVLVGFGGVLLIVDPTRPDWSWAYLIPVAAALASALRDITTRQVAATETASSLVFTTVGATVVAGALTLPFAWVTPSLFEGGLLLVLGLVHGCAYLMQVAAFRAAEASALAPFKYSLLLWAILLAWVVWGFVPGLAVLAGAALVIASGLFIYSGDPTRRPGPPAASGEPCRSTTEKEID